MVGKKVERAGIQEESDNNQQIKVAGAKTAIFGKSKKLNPRSRRAACFMLLPVQLQYLCFGKVPGGHPGWVSSKGSTLSSYYASSNFWVSARKAGP